MTMARCLHKSYGFIIAVILSFVLVIPTVWAVTGEILSDETAAEADAGALKDEAELFARIKDGVLLTLAECEISEGCSPSVDIREVENILVRIDTRITTLSNRYAQTSNQQLEEALLIYAEAREGYVKALDKLEALANEEGELSEDEFGGSTDEDVDFSDLFEDADEEL